MPTIPRERRPIASSAVDFSQATTATTADASVHAKRYKFHQLTLTFVEPHVEETFRIEQFNSMYYVHCAIAGVACVVCALLFALPAPALHCRRWFAFRRRGRLGRLFSC